MDVTQLKQYTERPKSDIENFVELAEKIDAKVKELNQGFEDNDVVVIGRDAEPTKKRFQYFIELEPAGIDYTSRHKIKVWFNYASQVTDLHLEDYQLKRLATKGKFCYLTGEHKTFEETDDMYCDEATAWNRVTITQKIRKSEYGWRKPTEEQRKWFRVGSSYGDNKQFKNHDKIIEYLFQKLETKRDRMYRDYDYKKSNRDRKAIHDIMENDATSMNMVAKERSEFDKKFGEMEPLTMNESMLPSNNVSCDAVYKHSDKYKLTVTFDDLSYDELKKMCTNTHELFSAYTSATDGNDNV